MTKTIRANRLNWGLTALLCLGGCHSIEPIEIKNGMLLFYKNTYGSVIKQPRSNPLTTQQIHFIQGWMNANRENWSSHTPTATLLPQWCISLQLKNEQSASFCRYGERVVLRGHGKEVEHSLSDSGLQDFAQYIENADY